jgi:hypothetical protein
MWIKKKGVTRMINCQGLLFSQKLSNDRLLKAKKVFGTKVIYRLLCFALYLFGVDRTTISKSLNIAPGSIRSIIRALFHSGLSALEDRRHSHSSFLPHTDTQSSQSVNIKEENSSVSVEFGSSLKLSIPRRNTFQTRIVLLTMVHNGFVRASEVGKVLGITPAHTRILADTLKREDVDTLIDKRQGQQMDYRFLPEMKGELIQQFVLDISVSGKTSGRLLSEHLKKRCGITLSERSIRVHMNKLGLSKIKNTLPKLIESLKKR